MDPKQFELSRRLSAIDEMLETVVGGDPVEILSYGQPVGVIVPIGEYEALRAAAQGAEPKT